MSNSLVKSLHKKLIYTDNILNNIVFIFVEVL